MLVPELMDAGFGQYSIMSFEHKVVRQKRAKSTE